MLPRFLLVKGSRDEAPQSWRANPSVGKLRWAAKGKGKSGAVRVIYYFHSEAFPVFLLSVYAKKQKANLTKAEWNKLQGPAETSADALQFVTDGAVTLQSLLKHSGEHRKLRIDVVVHPNNLLIYKIVYSDFAAHQKAFAIHIEGVGRAAGI